MHQRASLFASLPVLLAAVAVAPSAFASEHHGAAQDRVDDSAGIVNQMKQDPNLAHLLQRARGIFIIPHFGKAGFIVGGEGGGGVVMVKHDGRWSDPAFYNIGGGSIGFQAGGSGGSIAMLLMTPRAVHRFEDSSGKWSLNANAGLNLVTYNGNEHTSTGGDIVLWSNTRGLYGGLTAGVTDITPDGHMDRDYYHQRVDSRKILSGNVSIHNHAVADLRGSLQFR